MRTVSLKGLMFLGLAVAGISMFGTAPAQISRAYGACMSRAHGTLTAARTHSVLV